LSLYAFNILLFRWKKVQALPSPGLKLSSLNCSGSPEGMAIRRSRVVQFVSMTQKTFVNRRQAFVRKWRIKSYTTPMGYRRRALEHAAEV